MKILLADDHEVVRRGLRQILADEFGDATFAEAASGAEALERVRRETWNLLVLDINMPGRNGLDVLPELLDQQPGLRVLVLSIAPESEFAARALKKGAAGYLNKQTVAAELVSAVRRILAGGRYVSPAMTDQLATALAYPGGLEPHQLLSDRELQVMRLIAGGSTIKEIAAELVLSEKTVFTYRERLREKLGVKNDVALARYALRHGLSI